MMNLKKKERGITLIALVITIIVLLILAGVSIGMLMGDKGILNGVNDSKIETAIGTVKEQIGLYQLENRIEEKEVTPETLLVEGKVSRTVQTGENDKYYMYYALKDNSFEGMQGLGKGNLQSLKDIFLIDDNLNIKYIASNGKEYGDKIKEKILEDETEIRFSSKGFSEYISKISGVKEDEMKFKWMKNQTSLVISDPEVDSLQDLVFFPNLLSLQIGNDFSGKTVPNITSLDGIENCKKLTSIMVVQGNSKDYTAIRYLTNLNSFYKYGKDDYENIIENLKFCKNLKGLTLHSAGINDMYQLKELGNLNNLNLPNNNIKEIKGLENMTNLVSLDLGSNQIEVIKGLDNLKRLKKLNLNRNKFIDITPLSENEELIELNLKNNPNLDGNRENYIGKRLDSLNKISQILEKEGGKILLDINKLNLFNNYKILDLNDQKLITLEPLEGLTEVIKLDLSYNQLTLEDEKSQNILKSMTNLTELNLGENNINDVKVINSLNNLKVLNLQGKNHNINLVEIEDIISNLEDLKVSTKDLKTIINCNADKIIRLKIPNSSLTEIPVLTKFSKLEELSLHGNPKIENYNKILELSSLKKLTLTNNDLHGKKLDFSQLKNLETLNLYNNNLWTEDIENLKTLKNNKNLTINLSNNSIIDATALLELSPETKINLTVNINLSQDSKEKLRERFGKNVIF
ncbi:MAG: hypothetical protein ACLR9X_00650 [Clostridia bacterium]